MHDLQFIFRTDNSIKNHFYSKLRKFIRKILKTLLQENLNYEKGLDLRYYTSDRIYKIIKKNNIPYTILSKDIIRDMILLDNRSESENQTKSKAIKPYLRKFRKIRFFSLSKTSI